MGWLLGLLIAWVGAALVGGAIAGAGGGGSGAAGGRVLWSSQFGTCATFERGVVLHPATIKASRQTQPGAGLDMRTLWARQGSTQAVCHFLPHFVETFVVNFVEDFVEN